MRKKAIKIYEKSTLSTLRSNKEKCMEAAFVGSCNERIVPQNSTEIRLVKNKGT
jgi:hypothetical protein